MNICNTYKQKNAALSHISVKISFYFGIFASQLVASVPNSSEFYPETFETDCPNCKSLCVTLQQLAPNANAYYSHIATILAESAQYLQDADMLPSFVNRSVQIVRDLEQIFAQMNKLASFNFTSRRTCKIGGDFDVGPTILAITNGVLSTFMALLAEQHVPIADTPATTLAEAISMLTPGAAIGAQIGDLCSTYSSKFDEYYAKRILFLSTMREFFYSLKQNLIAVSKLTMTQQFCTQGSMRVEFDTQVFDQLIDAPTNGIARLEGLSHESAVQILEKDKLYCQHMPLTNVGGQNVAVIPEFPHEFIIEKDGQFLYQCSQSHWNPTTMSRTTQIVWRALDIHDGIITAPEKFEGAHAPRRAFIYIQQLSNITDKHLNITTEIVEYFRRMFK
ncbi:MAG: hypothetical protein LBR89_02115 [Holosporales bacterium]|jgi:hypothetical protein|nr:hypothetical protein [Holosporales bacterium]